MYSVLNRPFLSIFGTSRLLVLLIVVGLALVEPAFAQRTRITGVVRDSSGASVMGAQVKLSAGAYSAETSTDVSGAFTFDSVPSNSGEVTVTAKASGMNL